MANTNTFHANIPTARIVENYNSNDSTNQTEEGIIQSTSIPNLKSVLYYFSGMIGIFLSINSLIEMSSINNSIVQCENYKEVESDINKISVVLFVLSIKDTIALTITLIYDCYKNI